MKTTIFQTEIEIMQVKTEFAGNGHYRIKVILCHNETKEISKFQAVTNDMSAFNEANDIEDYDDRQLALFNLVKDGLSNQILEWLYQIEFTGNDESDLHPSNFSII